jgi:DNA-binding SARP family transcriptional activator/Tfp pilus assembly protein PilF
VEFRLFGSLEWSGEGQAYEFGSLKERCVLAILLLTPGQPVAIETLIDRVWDDQPPPEARKSVYSYIARLRSRLHRKFGDGSARLISKPGAYVLDVDPDRVDLHRSRRLYAQARAISDSGDAEDALRLLREAENLWRGPALAELSGNWVETFRVGLENEYRAIVGSRIALELQAGRHAEIVGELYGLTGRYPSDESFVEHLMIALYRCGRQSDALEAYHQCSHRLVGELGTEPGPSLRRTYERILRGDPGLIVPSGHRTPGAPLADNLPRDTPDFVGRQAELGRLYAGLRPAPTAVTVQALDGMAGVGKSALAIHAAHRLAGRFPDGRLYLNLGAHDPNRPPVDPMEGLETLLHLIGEQPERIPGTVEERAALWRARLADRRAIVILDNCADADQVRPFLPGAPGCLVLITSRRRLTGLTGVRPISLDALTSNEAALLFRRIVGEDRRLDVRDVDEVVRLCGYLPLAITMMANKLRHRPARDVGDLVAKLSGVRGRLAEIRAGDRDLVTAFELSYRELPPERRRAFRRLGLHIGTDLTAHTAAALIGCGLADAERVLEELIDHHLIEEPIAGRVRFHDLLRDYARERAQAEEPEGEIRRAVHRQLDTYLLAAHRADRCLYPLGRRAEPRIFHSPPDLPAVDDPRHATAWLRAERHNLLACVRYAAGHGFPTYAIDLSHALAASLERWAYWADSVRMHEIAQRVCVATGDRASGARIALELSLLRSRTGHYAAAFEHARAGLEEYRSLGDVVGEADALDHLARVSWLSGRNQDALEYAERARALFRMAGDRYGECGALVRLGIPLAYLGRAQEAVAVFEECLAIVRDIGDAPTEGMVLNNLGEIHRKRGDLDEALDLFRASLAIVRGVGWRQNEAVALNNIADVHQAEGRYEEALHFFREALAIYRETGDRRNEADGLSNIGTVYLQRNMYAEALIHFQKALAIATELDEPYERTRALAKIGEAQQHNGQLAAACRSYEQALELARGLGDPYLEGRSLEGLGDVADHLRGRKVAEGLWRQALVLYERERAVPDAEAVRARLRAPGVAG